MNYTQKLSFKALFATLVIHFCLISYPTMGQPLWQWGKTTVDIKDGRHIATDKRGNIFTAGWKYNVPVTVGTTTLAANVFPMVWIKYDANGNPVFADGIDGNTQISGIATDTAGNLIIFGEMMTDTIKIGPYALGQVLNVGEVNNYRYFVTKVSPSGTVLWAKMGSLCYLLSSYSLTNTWGKHVATDDSGNIYIATQFKLKKAIIETDTLVNTDTSGATTDILLAKYTPSGTLVWVKSAGGTGNDFANGITVNSDGNIYITGDFCSASIDFGDSTLTGPSHNKAYIAAYSPSGAALRAITTNNTDSSAGISIAHDNNGNIYLAGKYLNGRIGFGSITNIGPSSIYNISTFLYIFSSNLTPIWGKTIYSTGSLTNIVECYGITVSPCGVAISILPSRGHNIFSNTDSIYIDSVSNYSYIIIEYDFAGNIVDHNYTPLGLSGDPIITSNNIGDIFLTGSFHDTLTIGHDTLRAVPRIWPMQYLLTKYAYTRNTYPNHKDTTWCGTGSITLKAHPGLNGYLWNDGVTTANRTVNTSGTYWVTAANCTDSVIVDTFHVTIKGPPCKNEADEHFTHNEVRAIPNPASDFITIELGSVALKSASFINNIGQVVQSIVLTGNHTRVNVATLPPGLYTIRLMGQDGVVMVKFVKE